MVKKYFRPAEERVRELYKTFTEKWMEWSREGVKVEQLRFLEEEGYGAGYVLCGAGVWLHPEKNTVIAGEEDAIRKARSKLEKLTGMKLDESRMP